MENSNPVAHSGYDTIREVVIIKIQGRGFINSLIHLVNL